MMATCYKIAIVDYPGALNSAILGMRDMLSASQGFSDDRMSVSILTKAPEKNKKFDCIILPPSLVQTPPLSNSWVPNWITDQHQNGALICSVCAGIFWLLNTNLIQGRDVTTHWGLAATLKDRKDICLDTDRLLIEHADLITAGGLMAWIDLSLTLIGRFLGQEAMVATARHFIVDIGRHNQRLYAMFLPEFNHGDRAIIKVQHRIEALFKSKLQNIELARNAGMSLRSFLRRFKKATGMTPKEYIQHTRIEKARALLIQTKLPVGEVAFLVGYHDQSAFSRLFDRVSGESPSAFRKRYGTSK